MRESPKAKLRCTHVQCCYRLSFKFTMIEDRMNYENSWINMQVKKRKLLRRKKVVLQKLMKKMKKRNLHLYLLKSKKKAVW